MSWLFSQALVAAYSQATCSDGAPSVQSSETPTPSQSWPHGRTKARCLPSRFGTTWQPSTGGRGAELLTWFLAASRARTSALQASEPGSTANAPGCGPTWPVSLARFDPVSCAWKTPQLSLFGDLGGCLETWPRSGSMRNGECWARPMLEPRTNGTAFGSWPTLKASDGLKGGPNSIHGTGSLSLPAAVARAQKLPTLTVRGNYNRAGASPSSGDGLATVIGGSLNPTWCEWFMGWPIGWTELPASETDKCRSAQRKRSRSSKHVLV